jgi:hypothetical protein
MRFRLVLFLSAVVAAASMSAAASAAPFNVYHDGKDKAVESANPDLFRLDAYDLEPGCHLAEDLAVDGHIDIGDDVGSTHVFVPTFATDFSVDQVLVSGDNSGYRIYNAFDTGTINNDPDIDPTQSATNLEPLPGDTGVDVEDVIVCVSDHEDSGQNEPYEQADDGEVAATNRPIIQPELAALGVSAIEPLNTYKAGFGYSIERWYQPHTINDVPPFTLDLTDPMGFLFDDGIPTHVKVPTRIERDGVLRVNDFDDFGEQFASPHYERADHGQPEAFHMNGDPYAYLHNSVAGPDGSGRGPWGLLTFTTQGDLPLTWSLKASLAPERYLRSAEVTDDFLRAWEQEWQDYYDGEGPKPSLPLAPGTNSPAPDTDVIVNVPETAPPANTSTSTTNNNTVVQQVPMAVSNRCVSGKQVRITLKKRARKGSIRYVSAKGARTVKARRSGGRLRAKADFRGLGAERGSFATVTVREKMKKKGGWRERTKLFELC